METDAQRTSNDFPRYYSGWVVIACQVIWSLNSEINHPTGFFSSFIFIFFFCTCSGICLHTRVDANTHTHTINWSTAKYYLCAKCCMCTQAAKHSMNNAHVVGSSFQKVPGPVAEQTLLLASSTEQCASGFPLPRCLLKHFPFTLLLFALSWSSKPQRMEANEIPQPLPHPSPPHSCWEWKWLRAIRLTLGTSRNINGVATTSSWSCHLHPTVLLFFFLNFF